MAEMTGGGAAQAEAGELRERRLRQLEKDGMRLERIPEGERDAELCRAALSQNGMALALVPESVLDVHLCQKAVRTTGMALDLVPSSLRSRTVCLKALRQDGQALQFVPDELRDREVCLTALRQNSSALRHVPEALLDEELCREALRVDGRALEFVPEALRSPALCFEAARTSGQALAHVPEALRTTRLAARALLSAHDDVRRRTRVRYQAPPDWDEIRKSKPRDEWRRFENWNVEAPEDFPFPEELAPAPEEVASCLRSLARDFLEASGGMDLLEEERVPGRGRWLDLEDGEGAGRGVYGPALVQLLKGESDGRGLPLTAGALSAAAALLDWAAGWREAAPAPEGQDGKGA